MVNGEVANLGQRVVAEDRIRVDGQEVRRAKVLEAQVVLLNKADGVVCTRRDPEGRPTCFDDLPKLGAGRWINVGRLDINTTGALLLTNDGTLAHRLMHPSTGLDREYAVRVDRELRAGEMKALKEGVLIDDFVARFSDVRYYDGTGNNHWYHVVLMEGRHREVRRLFESQGVRVSRLKRVRFGPVVMPSRLRRGRWMELDKDDVLSLYRLLRLPVPRIRRPGRGKNQGKKEASVLVPYPELPEPTRRQ
jgi:23S rRNA pseudouridine2605 synthase